MILLPAILLLSAGTVLLVLSPLLRRPPREGRETPLLLYRDQMNELMREHTAGQLSQAALATAKLELQRRLLRTQAAPSVSWTPRRAIVVPVMAAVMALPLAIYLSLGHPSLKDQPLSARAEETEALRAILEAVAKARQTLMAAPLDSENWLRLIGLLLQREEGQEALGLIAEARKKFPAMALFPSIEGEVLTRANQGMVSGEAEEAFRSALALDAGDVRARYYLALAAEQRGALQEALSDIEALLIEGPNNAPWFPTVAAVRARLREALALPPAPNQLPEDSKTQSLIRAMVDRLADRLESQPDDLAGWLKLAQARGVLGETAAAILAYRRVLRLDPKSLDGLLGLARLLFPPGTNEPVSIEVADLMHQVLALDPNQLEALWLIGLEAAQRGDKVGALGHWQKLLALLPPNAPPRVQLQQEIERLAP